MRPLQVDTFTSRISCNQDHHIWIVAKLVFHNAAFVTGDPTMNTDNRFRPPNQCCQLAVEVIECVAVFSEYYQLTLPFYGSCISGVS